MSLILDALRKLERDKQPHDPGVVVVGPVPWGAADPRRRARPLAVAAALVAALVALGIWLLRSGPDRTAPGNDGRGTHVEEAQGPPASPATGSVNEAALPAAASALPAPATVEAPEVEPLARGGSGPPPPREIDLPGAGAASVVRPGEVPGTATPLVTSAPPTPEALDTEPKPKAPSASANALDQEAPEPPPTPAATRELRLTAISVRDGRPIALLNDRLVREGDSFDGVRVLRIGETEVEVEVDGKKRTISF